MAIYSYEAANEDELAFVENEELECVHGKSSANALFTYNNMSVYLFENIMKSRYSTCDSENLRGCHQVR